MEKKYGVYVEGAIFSSFFDSGFYGFYEEDEARKQAESFAKRGYKVYLLKVAETCEATRPTPALTWKKT